jgi:hypothetical protein
MNLPYLLLSFPFPFPMPQNYVSSVLLPSFAHYSICKQEFKKLLKENLQPSADGRIHVTKKNTTSVPNYYVDVTADIAASRAASLLKFAC